MKILVTSGSLKYGQPISSKYKIVYAPSEDKPTMMELVKEVDAIFARPRAVLDRDVIHQAKCLKVIARHGVGYDQVDALYAAERGIWVTNTPDIVSSSTATTTIYHLLNISRRFSAAQRGLPEQIGQDLEGKTLGILGMGRIGQYVALRATALDMKIIYHNRKPLTEDLEKKFGFATFMSKEQLIEQADFISVHVPGSQTTKHYLDWNDFSKMKKGVYIINTSRGTNINEDALVEALKSGKVAGAGLDVFEKEPKIHPELFNLPNVSMTPHIGTATEETRQKMEEMTLVNIDAVLSGKKPPNPVHECVGLFSGDYLRKASL